MNKTVWKIFISFTLISTSIALVLLCINFIGFAVLGSDISNLGGSSYEKILEDISANIVTANNKITLTNADVIPENNWCILIDKAGDIVWEHNRPSDIPVHYSINDVAKMTHWFLNDYPVYVRADDLGLFVLGIPKNAVGKYEMQYSMEWFENLPQKILMIIFINLFLAAVLALIFGTKLYNRIKTLTLGIKDLRQEKRVCIKEKGIFKELSKNINETSSSIARKNESLLSRDNARSNWIAGISHDIRTPLTMIMGYSEALSNSGELSNENKEKIELITNQSIKIKKLIDDLNLISSLEYDMQPSKKKDVALCPLLRSVASDMINSGISENYNIELDLSYEKARIICDEALIRRALFNILNNSVCHNKNGCEIRIKEYAKDGNVYVEFSDNGIGIPTQVIESITEIPKSKHGLGLPMAYKIMQVHGFKMLVQNQSGAKIIIEV